MGERYLVDSNVIIYFSANRISDNGTQFVENLFDSDFIISVVTEIEVLGYDEIPSKINLLEEFLNTAFIFQLDKEIVKQTILLRRKVKKLKLGDAIIAATALTKNLILITRNTKDFEKILDLKTINPYEL